MDRPRVQTLINELRGSLEAVTVEEKEPVLMLLSEIEENCVEGEVTDFDDPRAIPGLAKALSSGFPIAARELADFGEQAVPVLLDVIRSAENWRSTIRPSELTLRIIAEGEGDRVLSAGTVEELRRVAQQRGPVGPALLALRYMVEGSEARPLSAATLEEIRNVAEHWLTKPEQSISTLGQAIDLAVVLGDPDLRRIVESLASDPNEVIAVLRRQSQRPRTVDWIQRQAADRLSGDPPLPRR